jgi:hypothetical protein
MAIRSFAMAPATQPFVAEANAGSVAEPRRNQSPASAMIGAGERAK